MYCWMREDKGEHRGTSNKYLGDSKRQIKKWSLYCWEWVCISFWNLGIAQLYYIYGKLGGLQITFTFVCWTVRNHVIINTISKSATNPKEDAKLLQSRLGFQWPIVEFVFSWNGLSPAILHRLKNPGKSKEEKAAIPTLILELCFSLFIPSAIAPYSLPMVEESLNLFELVSTIFERDEGQQKKEEG